MGNILVLSDRVEDVAPLLAALQRGNYRAELAPLDAALGADPDPDAVLIDAVKDLGRARDACRGLRAQSARLTLIAIANAEDLESIGPDWGIDSFVTDGAPAEELLARIRIARGPQDRESAAAIRVGDLTIDPETYQVRIRSRPLDLTYKEFQLLAFLAQRPARVFSRAQILQEVWGYDFFGGTRTVDVHVRRLRAKLGAEHEALVATVRNVGYKLEPPRDRA